MWVWRVQEARRNLKLLRINLKISRLLITFGLESTLTILAWEPPRSKTGDFKLAELALVAARRFEDVLVVIGGVWDVCPKNRRFN